ncbi:hypothetical protein K505DRAFT_369084 [Melanomma pulvis-pyrius CBS 109.77]|uniref:Uncharacterized protein n=1 Tax=Melanomma pulvis-pyrius CBS 109.77 TaxID=1314802 RepID=A0A6A6WN92_9PLEO|nr:hypothetical protein K505DRAFT_369084 [Melanomma pulvis-pyrius CBS 109.77]
MGFKSMLRTASGSSDRYVVVDAAVRPLQPALMRPASEGAGEKKSSSSKRSGSSSARKLIGKVKMSLLQKFHRRYDSGPQGGEVAAVAVVTATQIPMPLNQNYVGTTTANAGLLLPPGHPDACKPNLNNINLLMILPPDHPDARRAQRLVTTQANAVQVAHRIDQSEVRLSSMSTADNVSVSNSLPEVDDGSLPVIEPETIGTNEALAELITAKHFAEEHIKKPSEELVEDAVEKVTQDRVISWLQGLPEPAEGSTQAVSAFARGSSTRKETPLQVPKNRSFIKNAALGLTKKQLQLRKYFWDMAHVAAECAATECVVDQTALRAMEFFLYLGRANSINIREVDCQSRPIIFQRSDLSQYEWDMITRVEIINLFLGQLYPKEDVDFFARARSKHIEGYDAEEIISQLFPTSANEIMDGENFDLLIDNLAEEGVLTNGLARKIKQLRMSEEEFDAEHTYTAPKRATRRRSPWFFNLPHHAGTQDGALETSRHYALRRLTEAAVYQRQEWKNVHYANAAGSLQSYYDAWVYTSQNLDVPFSLRSNNRDWTYAEERLLRRANAVLKLRDQWNKQALTDFSVLKAVRAALVPVHGQPGNDFEGLETFLYSRASEPETGLTAAEIPQILILHPELDADFASSGEERLRLQGLLREAVAFEEAEVQRRAEIRRARRAYRYSLVGLARFGSAIKKRVKTFLGSEK